MIYFDNSATTYPKPYSFYKAAEKAFSSYSFNIGRGGYKASLKASEKVFEVRELISGLFGFKSENIAFTKNCTEALNIAIKGIAEKGCHFVISPFEHNSIYRVLYKLENEGFISFDIAEYSKDMVSSFKKKINSKTKAVICTHSSNVFGITMPIRELGKLCAEKGIFFILDASQGAGLFDINAVRDNIDILCASGHKALYGAMGTGFLALKDGITLNTVTEGGTGSNSLEAMQPMNMPDRLESGTLNVPGIVLLGKGIKFIKRKGIDAIYRHDLSIINYLFEELKKIYGITLYTESPKLYMTAPVLPFNFSDFSSEKTASLFADYNICTRGGYHCSPLAHRTMGTLDRGCVRISAGCFNTFKDCDNLLRVIKKL